MWEDKTKTLTFHTKQHVIENILWWLKIWELKISVDSGDGGNLSCVGFVHVLNKREDITDYRNKNTNVDMVWI